MGYVILGAIMVLLAVLVQGVIAECKQGDCESPGGGD